MAVVATGRPAVTEFERIEDLGEYSLLRVHIRTGRTHQIRVHLAWLGHPVAGDPMYCRRDPLGLNGQFLHARHLGLHPPQHGAGLRFRGAPAAGSASVPWIALRAECAGHQEGTGNSHSDDSLRILDGFGLDAASGVR